MHVLLIWCKWPSKRSVTENSVWITRFPDKRVPDNRGLTVPVSCETVRWFHSFSYSVMCIAANHTWVWCSPTLDGRHQDTITSLLLEQTCNVTNQKTCLCTVQATKVSVRKRECVHSIMKAPFFQLKCVTSHAINQWLGISPVTFTVHILATWVFVIFYFSSNTFFKNPIDLGQYSWSIIIKQFVIQPKCNGFYIRVH